MAKILHFPRLDTILRVEEVIKKADDGLSKNEIDRRLKKKIMRPTLNLIIKYLEDSGKIGKAKSGYVWIYYEDASDKLKKTIERSIRVR